MIHLVLRHVLCYVIGRHCLTFNTVNTDGVRNMTCSESWSFSIYFTDKLISSGNIYIKVRFLVTFKKLFTEFKKRKKAGVTPETLVLDSWYCSAATKLFRDMWGPHGFYLIPKCCLLTFTRLYTVYLWKKQKYSWYFCSW